MSTCINFLAIGSAGTAFVITPPIPPYDGDLSFAVRSESPAWVAAYAPLASPDALEDGFDSLLVSAINLVQGPDADRGIPRRIRAMADVFIANDAPIYPGSGRRSDPERVALLHSLLDGLAAIHPALAFAVWSWHPHGQVPGLDDPATRAWATSRAAQQIEQPWAMTLLAALGASAQQRERHQ